ncbi:hypothetical protein Scep_028026 [Stephania cephalantha]|uniref:Uncharacterized protein n=1 Tax=Stephania cephalantha TaxID=152367 RepID=A0AAP0EHI4_9MAGN
MGILHYIGRSMTTEDDKFKVRCGTDQRPPKTTGKWFRCGRVRKNVEQRISKSTESTTYR